ncbi:hypothetical protein Mpe_B0524 (plasmid) [Methylibium petroleiphilum PM1]|uniref:Transposase n=2 Tax=Methylibium TaxID=316612 RepID=A2SP07_METPP|nr:hypothetical protein Mpe_B0524 [Methylibium petroleiphilum PM1]
MGRRRRRQHSAKVKATVIEECLRPGVSITAAALAHGLNANMLRKWAIDAEHKEPVPHPRVAKPLPDPPPVPPAQFVPLALSGPTVDGEIRIELRRAGTTVKIVWPAPADRDYEAWLIRNRRSKRPPRIRLCRAASGAPLRGARSAGCATRASSRFGESRTAVELHRIDDCDNGGIGGTDWPSRSTRAALPCATRTTYPMPAPVRSTATYTSRDTASASADPPRAVIRRHRLQQQQLVRRDPLALIEATTEPRTYASCKSVVSVFFFRNALECPTGGEVIVRAGQRARLRFVRRGHSSRACHPLEARPRAAPIESSAGPSIWAPLLRRASHE